MDTTRERDGSTRSIALDKGTRNFRRSKKVASKFVRRISILLIRRKKRKIPDTLQPALFWRRSLPLSSRGRGVHLGNAFPVEPTALRPFLLKLGHSVPRFGKTEFQRKLFTGVAVNAKLLRLFLRTRRPRRWAWRSHPSWVRCTFCSRRVPLESQRSPFNRNSTFLSVYC